MAQNKLSVQDWINIEEILENGIIKLKNNKYVKILKIIPINFNLKSNLEKESILASYKIFLKTCNFDIQILIQSNKENLQNNILNIKNNLNNESEKYLKNISEDYIKFINKLNSLKTSSSKEFYIIISGTKNIENNKEIIDDELNEKFLKIKECLTRCGNKVINLNNKKEIQEIIFSFLNSRIYLK